MCAELMNCKIWKNSFTYRTYTTYSDYNIQIEVKSKIYKQTFNFLRFMGEPFNILCQSY